MLYDRDRQPFGSIVVKFEFELIKLAKNLSAAARVHHGETKHTRPKPFTSYTLPYLDLKSHGALTLSIQRRV